MFLVILAIWFGYKKAKATGRNPILWAIICAVAFIGTQFLVAALIGLTIGIGVGLFGWSETLYNDHVTLISVVALVVSFISLFLVFRYLDRVPKEPPAIQQPPPPPPTFGDQV